MEGKSSVGHRYILHTKLPQSWIWKCSKCSNKQYTQKNEIPNHHTPVLVKSGLVSPTRHLSCEEYVLWQVML